MANPNFEGIYSTNNIWRDSDDTRCLTDDLDAIESDIADLETGKAESNHTHDGYAVSNHSHSEYAGVSHEHTGYAASDHSHSAYAPVSHSHDYADSNHTHSPASIGAAASNHSHDYAASTHSHAQTEITGLESALAAKANASAMSGKADLVDGKVPSTQLPGFVDDVLEYANLAAFPAAGESGKIYVAQDTNKTYRWSGTGYVVISDTLALGETSATAYRGDRGKAAYDHSQNSGVHVTAAQKSAWDAKSNFSGSYNDLTNKPTIPAAYTHPASHPASMISGLSTVATSGSYNDLTDKPTIPTIPASLPANGGNADTVDGKHASDFATASHNHDSDYADKGHSHTVFPSDTTLAAYKLVYIATNGNDSKDGFTQANAMATIKGVIKKYADSYKALDIRLLDGTYTEDTWSISVDQCNLSIRSASENKDAVTLNLTGNLETNVSKLRLYNMTINVTETNVRALSVTAGSAYCYNVRFNVPAASDASCVNVYNGASAFLMNCVLNSGTGTTAGAAVYGNQAMIIKAINCKSERTVRLGFHAHNGSDIIYTDTLTATTKTKVTSWGKCTLRS